MLEEEVFSPALLRALRCARRRAAELSLPAVLEPQLLAALLSDLDSRAVALLIQYGASVERLSADAIPPPANFAKQNSTSADDFPLSAPVWTILHRAKEATTSGSSFEPVGSEDVLVAALEIWPQTATLLDAYGVDCQALTGNYRERRMIPDAAIDVGPVDFNPKRSVEETDLARILDANFNRAREALRVIEDYARFVRNDAGLSQRVKDCRHSLRTALTRLPFQFLSAARDTDKDVGVDVKSDDENIRGSLADVVAANCKRAQEAVRTLEEYSKIESPDAAAMLERIRYELYKLEKLLLMGRRSAETFAGVALYWLADPERCRGDFAGTVERALTGGVQVVQLRDKSADSRQFLERARLVRHLARLHHASFIVNDRPDIARLSDADGVHLGQDDLPVNAARKIVGPDAIIGVSTHDMAQARQAVRDGADYIGVGPVFTSQTKSFAEFPGIDFVRQVAAEIRIPAFSIGGIDASRVPDVLQAGSTRIAVSHAISNADDTEGAARRLLSLLSANRH